MTKAHAASWRLRCYQIIGRNSASDEALSSWVQTFLILCIVLNVSVLILGSIPSLSITHDKLMFFIELVTVTIFVIEYLLRVWCAPEHPPWRTLPTWRARLYFIVMPMSIIDSLAIIPFFIAFVLPINSGLFVVLRLFRFFKLGRYSTGLASLMDAFYAERKALTACIVILFGTILFSATMMYLAERYIQPEKFGTIPLAMYWATITLTTVGYGDVTPMTPIGKLLAGSTAILGLVMLALPVGILSSAFVREIHRRDFVVTWGMVARVPLFSTLDANQIANIMQRLHSKVFETGQIILRKGEEVGAVCFISSGSVSAMVDGKRVELQAGRYFGDSEILPLERRSTSAKASSRCELLVIAKEDIALLADEIPDLAEYVDAVGEDEV